jgi:hypothetical protein
MSSGQTTLLKHRAPQDVPRWHEKFLAHVPEKACPDLIGDTGFPKGHAQSDNPDPQKTLWFPGGLYLWSSGCRRIVAGRKLT